MADNLHWFMSRGDYAEGIQHIGVRAPGSTVVIKFERASLKKHACGRELLQQLEEKVEHDSDWPTNHLLDAISDDILEAIDRYGHTGAEGISEQSYSTVQDYYSTSIVWLELCVDEDQLVLQPVEDQQPVDDWLPIMEADLLYFDIEIPRIDASQLRVISPSEESEDQQHPDQVYHEDDTTVIYNFKPITLAEPENVEDRLNVLIPLRDDDYDIRHRINRIEALVHHAGEPDRILGYLQQFIENNGAIDDYIYEEKITPHLRDKWTTQLHETINALHKRGIVLGEINAGTIVIDTKNENAWITSFEFAWNEGIDKPHSSAFEGDILSIEDTIIQMNEVCP